MVLAHRNRHVQDERGAATGSYCIGRHLTAAVRLEERVLQLRGGHVQGGSMAQVSPQLLQQTQGGTASDLQGVWLLQV